MKSLIIFDLDGTLLNTIEDLAHAANHALQCAGFPTHEIASYRFYVGNGVSRLLERVLPPDARNPENVERLRGYFHDYYSRHLTDYTRPYPGIPELLDDLTVKGFKIAVASNKYQEATSALIAHFFGHIPFCAVHGMRPGIPAKPDPTVVFNILAANPTPKDAVLYVGDSGVDMETARRACVESAGVTWGFRPVSELRQFYAEHIVSMPETILKIAQAPLSGFIITG